MECIYIFMRRDLGMRRGKEIAQAAHAVIGLDCGDAPIITLQARSEEDLLKAIDGRRRFVVRDAGRTEVEPGTITCAAVLARQGAFPDRELY